MLRALLLSLVFLFAASNMTAQNPDTAKTKKDPIVYITRKGTKYHRDSCHFLTKSRIAIPLSEAKKYYTPCKICKPPE